MDNRYYFFRDLYMFDIVREAFDKIFINKLNIDGYIDINKYISRGIKKDEMAAKLSSVHSELYELYRSRSNYPTEKNIISLWHEHEKITNSYTNKSTYAVTNIEYEAVVNWILNVYSKESERREFAEFVLKYILKIKNNNGEISYENGVAYDRCSVDISFISSIASLSDFLTKYKSKDSVLFFRGHADANFQLLPSVLRETGWRHKENKMYNELQVNCPEAFTYCNTHLEKLVTMQHYGLPTRLLDITRNPLVAMYFACQECQGASGEMIVFMTKEDRIKYPGSDSVSILSSLPLFSDLDQKDFRKSAEDNIKKAISNEEFNDQIERLVHAVRLEKPAFQPQIRAEDLLGGFFVSALKNNKRINKQDGAFFICGLGDVTHTENMDFLSKFRYCKNNKKIIALIKPSDKNNILEELDSLSINHATLFPEIDSVAEYIKHKYFI